MGFGVVMTEVASVGSNLVDVCLLGSCCVFVFENEDRITGEDDNIRSTAALAGKFVFEDDCPISSIGTGL